jgi:preprotein translocase subunit SecG
MYELTIVLIFIVCVLLVLVVLVQNSKGGGLASSFSSNNQIMGVRRTTDFLEKATWGLAGALLFLCVVASAFIPREVVQEQSIISKQIETAVDPSQAPVFPSNSGETQAPASSTEEQPAE